MFEKRYDSLKKGGKKETKKKGASVIEAEKMSLKPPPVRPLPDVVESPKDKDIKPSVKPEIRREATSKEETVKLPSSVSSSFEGFDFSDVKVIRNSQIATKMGVDAFTLNNEIHVSEGKWNEDVLRHEATHIVQKSKDGEGVAVGRDIAEKEAEESENKKKIETEFLSPVKKNIKHNKVKTDKRIPKVEITVGPGGKLTFDKISGTQTFNLAGYYWPGPKSSNVKKFISLNQFWRIPAFPVAGVSLQLDVGSKALVAVRGKINYAFDFQKKAFVLTGTGEVAKEFEIFGTVTAGGGVDAVLVSGGVGVFGKIGTKLSQTAGVGVEGMVSSTGTQNVKFFAETTVGGSLKGDVGVAAWVDGWFYDDRWEWTLASFDIAHFTNFKVRAGMEWNSQSGWKGFGDVKAGLVGLGKPPKLDTSSGKRR